ncbi:MAG: Lrp/AsnC family transcriptional regulator [Lentisphaeria bacterium]|nr:Lrp/AsnC family transcriptional regulator [Lentisphaeria bacterium]
MTKEEIRREILRILGEDGRLTSSQIAERLAVDVQEVAETVAELEKKNVIIGYSAIFNESELPESKVKAVIEVKVRPEREGGFDKIARRLSRFPQVSSLYLMSGGFDLLLEIKGATLQEVAEFVSSKLASMDGVLSTSTHFLLKKYKEAGKLMEEEEQDERLKITP